MRLSATFLLLVGLCGGEVAYKRDSVARKRAGDHPSLRPTRGRCFQRTGSSNPLLGLAPDGVYQASHVAVAAGALLPHRFSLACNVPTSEGWTIHRRSLSVARPSGRPNLALASIQPCGVPTFLDGIARKLTAAVTRPPHHCPRDATAQDSVSSS